jgi:hypothetical protein
MDAAFSQAAAPEPFRVLGRNLKPYTIGHQLLLERFESGYAVGSTVTPTWDDFLFSVWICSQSYAEVLRALNARFTFVRVALWSRRCGKFDVPEAQEFFRRYMHANTSEPLYFKEDGPHNCSEIAMPWGLFLKQYTQERLHLRESEVVDYPYIDANLLYLRHLAERGALKLATKTDLQLIAAVKRMDAQQRQHTAMN